MPTNIIKISQIVFKLWSEQALVYQRMDRHQTDRYIPGMRGSSNFLQGGGGGPGQSDKKSSDNVTFLVLSLFYWSQMVNFYQEIYHFSRFQRGSNIFQGVSNVFQGGGGGQLLIPYRNPCNL